MLLKIIILALRDCICLFFFFPPKHRSFYSEICPVIIKPGTEYLEHSFWRGCTALDTDVIIETTLLLLKAKEIPVLLDWREIMKRSSLGMQNPDSSP